MVNIYPCWYPGRYHEMNWYSVLGVLILSVVSLCRADLAFEAPEHTASDVQPLFEDKPSNLKARKNLGKVNFFNKSHEHSGVHHDVEERTHRHANHREHHNNHKKTIEVHQDNQSLTAWGALKAFIRGIFSFIFSVISGCFSAVWMAIKVLFGALSLLQTFFTILIILLIVGAGFGIYHAFHGGLFNNLSYLQ